MMICWRFQPACTSFFFWVCGTNMENKKTLFLASSNQKVTCPKHHLLLLFTDIPPRWVTSYKVNVDYRCIIEAVLLLTQYKLYLDNLFQLKVCEGVHFRGMAERSMKLISPFWLSFTSLRQSNCWINQRERPRTKMLKRLNWRRCAYLISIHSSVRVNL